MTISIHVISDSDRLHDIRELWDGFVGTHANNPEMLSGFVEAFMASAPRGWAPLLLLFMADKELIGTVPLLTRKKFGIRYACLLYHLFTPPTFSDFYSEICISRTLDLLFGTLGCQFVSLVLPATSHAASLLRQCHEKLCVFQREFLGQSILPLQSSWSEFSKSRGKKLLQDIRRTERRLGQNGQWRCHRFEGPDRAHEAFEQIMRIERSSWKQISRSRRRKGRDMELLMLWEGAQRTSKAVPSFRWHVWFLEVNDRMVAYALFFRYKDTAFAVKTSYDREFAKYGVGIYLMNVAIRKLFEEGQVKKIDFISDVPFTKTWTSLRLRRIHFLITSRTGIPRFIVSCLYHWAFGPKLQKVWRFGRGFPSIFSYLNALYDLDQILTS